MADPGFPVGGGVHPLGGHGPLMWALFGENVCENERIGSRCGGGVCPACPPRSANDGRCLDTSGKRKEYIEIQIKLKKNNDKNKRQKKFIKIKIKMKEENVMKK